MWILYIVDAIGGGKRSSCGILGPINVEGRPPRTDAQVQLTCDKSKGKAA